MVLLLEFKLFHRPIKASLAMCFTIYLVVFRCIPHVLACISLIFEFPFLSAGTLVDMSALLPCNLASSSFCITEKHQLSDVFIPSSM